MAEQTLEEFIDGFIERAQRVVQRERNTLDLHEWAARIRAQHPESDLELEIAVAAFEAIGEARH